LYRDPQGSVGLIIVFLGVAFNVYFQISLLIVIVCESLSFRGVWICIISLCEKEMSQSELWVLPLGMHVVLIFKWYIRY
jgi:hypothetical protein